MKTDEERATWAASILTAYAEGKMLEAKDIATDFQPLIFKQALSIHTVIYWIRRSIANSVALIRVKE